jgi:hypothetical protein
MWQRLRVHSTERRFYKPIKEMAQQLAETATRSFITSILEENNGKTVTHKLGLPPVEKERWMRLASRQLQVYLFSAFLRSGMTLNDSWLAESKASHVAHFPLPSRKQYIW